MDSIKNADLNISTPAAGLRGRRIVLSAQKQGGLVQIAVRDFGSGFSITALETFERHQKITDGANGTGRGLLADRSLIAAAGSTLRVHPSPVGATVTIDLPTSEVPSWYFDAQTALPDEVFVLDDEEIAVKLSRMMPMTHIQGFLSEADFLAAARGNPGAFLFVDYGFAGKRTGLDLIIAEGISERAVLFTGRAYFDTEPQLRAIIGNVKILPKECILHPGADESFVKSYTENVDS